MEGESAGPGFTISSWNINGIRTLDMKDVISKLNSQIVCVQETKISRDQLDEETAFISDCSSFFAFSRNRNGYSGVATYCDKRFTPVKAEEGLCGLSHSSKTNVDPVLTSHNFSEEERTLARFGDLDGRCIITQHLVQIPGGDEKPLTVFNVYCPRLRNDPSDPVNNKDFKETFHALLETRAKEMSAFSFVLIVGDLNISHKPIDVSDAVESPNFNENTFRQRLDEFLSLENREGLGFRDTYRMLHPSEEKAFSCWCTRTNARQNNYGTRIDYIIADQDLAQYLGKAEIHSEIMGSDHCPISATFHSLTPIPSPKHPALATKFYSEFSGKQQKLKDFIFNSKTIMKTMSVSSSLTQPVNNTNRKRSAPCSGSKQMNLKSFFTKIPKVGPEVQSLSSSSSSSPDIIPEKDESLLPNSDSNGNGNFWKATAINVEATSAWKKLLKGPEIPMCPGHKEPCHLRTVKKKGTNQGRQFWSCPKGMGSSSDPNASCNYFQWVVNTKSSKLFAAKEKESNSQ